MTVLAPYPAPRRWVLPAARPRLRVFVALVLLVVAAGRAFYLAGPLRSDEAGYLLVARDWSLHGPFLYGHYFVDRPPLLLALFKIASWIPYEAAIRLLANGAALVLVGAAALAAREVGGHRSARWAAVVAAALALSPAAGATEANGEIFAVPLVMLAVWTALVAARTVALPRTRVLAGVAAGASGVAAVMVKQSFVDGAAFAAVLVVTSVLMRRLTPREGGLAATGGVLGAVLVLLPMLGYAAASGAGVRGAIWTLLGFRSSALTVIGTHSLGAVQSRALTLAALSLVSGAAPVLVLLARHALRRGTGRTPLGWTIAATAGVELASIAAGGNFWQHYLVQLDPMVALGLGLLAPRHELFRKAAVFVLASALAMTVSNDLIGTNRSRDGYLAGRWVHDSAQRGDTATVLFGHAEVLEGAGLPSPYPHLWSLPTRILDPRLIRLRHTLASGPTWVVVWDGVNTWGIDGRGSVRTVLRAHFRRVGTVCGHQVWLRDGVERPLPPLPVCH